MRSRGVCAARWDEGGSEAEVRLSGVRDGVLEMALELDGVESMMFPAERLVLAGGSGDVVSDARLRWSRVT